MPLGVSRSVVRKTVKGATAIGVAALISWASWFLGPLDSRGVFGFY